MARIHLSKAVEEIGFKKRVLNTQYKVFTILEFSVTDAQIQTKPKATVSNHKNNEGVILKPCLYKRDDRHSNFQ